MCYVRFSSIQEYRIQSAQTQSWTKFADSTILVYSVRTLYIECYLKTYISLVLRDVFLVCYF